jgi:hypothetical protein
MQPRTILRPRNSISLLIPCCCWASFSASPLTRSWLFQQQPLKARLPGSITVANSGRLLYLHSSHMAPKVVTTANGANSPDDVPVEQETKRPARNKRSAAKVQESTEPATTSAEDDADPPKKQRASRKSSKASADTEATPKKKAPTHQVLTERDHLPKLWDDGKAATDGSYSKCCSSGPRSTNSLAGDYATTHACYAQCYLFSP